MKIPVARVDAGTLEIEAVARVIHSGWLTAGPEVDSFEAEFAAAVGAPYACAVSSGTAALHLAILTAGVQPGDEVVTASYSFIATASAIRYCGATPVFADIRIGTGNLDPTQVEAAITPKTKAILCVHQAGMPCDLPAFQVLSRRHNLPLIEDAACAAGSQIVHGGHWNPIGKPHGDLCCFSFHPRKVLTTGDGGMVTTARADWNQRLHALRHHGMNIPAYTRHTSARVIRENYGTLGFNYRLTDIQAAIGRVQLQRLPTIVASRRAAAARYFELLAGIPGLHLPAEPTWARSNWQSFLIRLDPPRSAPAIMAALLEAGIATRGGIMCSHREPAYPPHTWRAAPAGLPNSELAQDSSIVLPLYPQITPAEQHYIAQTLRKLCSL